jgi:3-oxoacyl-[acyl-carrier protein] reductase
MWYRMFDINVKGVYLCAKAFLPYAVNRKHGRMINISSVWGITGASTEVHYSASKAAVIGFTKALAKEAGPSNITVNCIAPGLIQTDMNKDLSDETLNALISQTPMNRIGTPNDIADLALFLASDRAGFITGQVIAVDGGLI